MKITVNVETKTFVRFLLVLSGFVGVVFLVWKLWAALMIIAISVFLALALNPPVSVLTRRLPGQSRILATALAYMVVLSILATFIYVALPPVIDQTVKFVNALPQYVQELSEKRGVVADLINRYGLQEELNQLVAGAQQQAASLASGLGSSVVNGVSTILGGVVTLITVLVLTFLMLIEGPRWMERLWNLYSNSDRLQRHQRLVAKMYKVVSGYVNGQVVVAAIAAVAGLATLLIMTSFFNITSEAVIPLAGIIFITDLIPMIGATIGAIIVGLVLLFNDPASVLVFVAYFLIYQQIENNFIQPLVQSRTVALSALSVFVAVILGISLLGIVGGIVAIPVAGCIRVVAIDYLEHRKHVAERPKPGLFAKLVAKARSTS
jgi:predicted PurR-regulated permease PerM